MSATSAWLTLSRASRSFQKGTSEEQQSRGGMHATDMELRNHLKNKCQQCGKSFTRKGDMTRHKEQVHMKVKNHACDTCEQRFGLKHHLTRHKARVHMKEKKHACDICGQRFGLKHHMTRHRESVHEVHFEKKRDSHLTPDLPSSIEVAPLIDGVPKKDMTRHMESVQSGKKRRSFPINQSLRVKNRQGRRKNQN